MPTFNFNMSVTTNVVAKKRNYKKSKIVIKGAEGIVWLLKSADYRVIIDNKSYIIHPNCYSCKGNERVYRQGEDDNNRFVWIRCKGECYECNPNLYLPFGVGCIVEGDVVFDVKTLVEMFYIKKCYTDPYNQDAKYALNHYRRNMNTINSIIRERRNKI